MKRFYTFTLILTVLAGSVYSQNVGINSTGAAPDASAMLDIVSTGKGLLIPRMTTANRTGIGSPATGLLVFDTDLGGFYYYDGAEWERILDSDSGWELDGNTGTTGGTDYVGTTDAQVLDFRTSGTQRFRIPVANQVHAMATGTAALPFYSFDTDPNTGVYRSAADELSFAAGGTQEAELSTTFFRLGFTGSAGTPAYSFIGDVNTGIFQSAADRISFSTGGINRAQFYADGTYYHEGSAATTFDAMEVDAPTGILRGIGPIWGYSPAPGQDGNAYEALGINYGILGNTAGNRRLTFGVAGQHDTGTTRRSGGVIGFGGAYWGALSYYSNGSTSYAVYAESNEYGDGAGYMSSNVRQGVGIGAFSGFIGSIIHSEFIGSINIGEYFSQYNIGDTYISGKTVELVQVSDKVETLYTNSSTDYKIYDDGTSNLKNGESYVAFNDVFLDLIEPGVKPTITISPMGECSGLYIKEITEDGFYVREMNGGKSDVAFTWISIGKRKDENGVPKELLDSKFKEKVSNVVVNESNMTDKGNPIWWDGTKIVMDQLPPKIPDLQSKTRRIDIKSSK